MNPRYIPVIDSLRGVAAMSVALFHFICTTTGFIKNECLLTVFSFGRLGVYMFFVISGIVIPLSLINSKYSLTSFPRFILKRIIRLDPPYFIAFTLGIAAAYIRLHVPGTVAVDTTPSTKEILLHIGYLIPFFDNVRWLNPAFWTLAIEFQYYIILALTIGLFIHRNIALRSVGYLLFLSMGIVSYLFNQKEFVPIYLPLFLLGISYCTYLCNIITATEQIIVMTLCLAILFITNGAEVMVTAIITLGIIHFFSTYTNKITRFFGNISYSVYLIHGLIGAAFVNVLSHKVENPILKMGVISCGVIVTIIASWIMYKLVEEPSKKFASKIGSKG